jgi:phosphoribosylglycinamide formyltransferase
VFVSGGGSNFRAIHAAILDGRIGAGAGGGVLISAVVTDVPSCGGAQHAREHGVPVLAYPRPKSGAFEALSAGQLADALRPDGGADTAADVVLLAGFLKLVPPEVVRCFRRRMLNIHPALLPAFGGKGLYGERVHRAVIASGARFSGPTVHFVDEEYDTGPILAQRCVPVFPDDTPARLARRVLMEEHLVYPEAVAALVEGRVTWREDGVPVVWSAH